MEEDHLESRQNDKTAFRIIRFVPTVNTTNAPKVISGGLGDIIDGKWRERS